METVKTIRRASSIQLGIGSKAFWPKLSPILLFALSCAFSAASCGRSPSIASGPLPQRGYLWQRDWTPGVGAALVEANRRLQGVVLLGAEIEWSGNEARVVRANIDWERLKKMHGARYSIALRVAPFALPPNQDDPAGRTIGEAAKSLLAEARAHHLSVAEFQLDFDYAQKNLASYCRWLHRMRAAIHPTRFVITTLPAWLDEPEFAALAGEVDGFVLQVHSVPFSNARVGTLCDPLAARRWVKQAAKLHRPFSIALPTYRCTAGYNRACRLIGVAMDAVQPAWPPDTRRLEFAADADQMAALVNEWEHARPAELREILWYRIPVTTDARNWRWPTLAAVMAGRKPKRHFEVRRTGENPVDLALVNDGETDEEVRPAVEANWEGGRLVAMDALAGWRIEAKGERAFFTVTPGSGIRLPPGGQRNLGWLRYNAPVRLGLSCREENEITR